jgi:hypothetical protein
MLIAGLVLPTTALLSAAPASAASISCNISHTTKVAPGLEQPPAGDPADAVQTFTVTAALTACTGAPGITKGTATGVLKSISPSMPKCSDLATPGAKAGTVGSARINVKWNKGATSASTLLVTVDAPQHGTLSGKVTSGKFLNKHVGGASSFNIAAGNCSDATPVTKLAGTGTFTLS